jgi:predicted ester cyclase
MSNQTITATTSQKETVRRLFEELINERRFDLAEELISPNFVNLSDGNTGIDGYLSGVRFVLGGFPDVHFNIEELFGEDDRVAVRWRWEGTHQGVFIGIPPTGRTVNHTGNIIFHLKDGKIVSQWVEMERGAVLRQIQGEA